MFSSINIPVNLYSQPEFRKLAREQINTYYAGFRFWHFLLNQAAINDDRGRISASAQQAYTNNEIKQVCGIANARHIKSLCQLLLKVGLLRENDKHALYIANWQQFCPENATTTKTEPTTTTKTVKSTKVVVPSKVSKTPNLKHPATTLEQKRAQQIVTELAQISGKTFPQTERHENYVVAWLQRGYQPEQFKQVSLAKSAEWGTQIEMRKFVRPRTLFGPKFINYVNDIVPERPVTVVHHVEPISETEVIKAIYLDCDRDLDETFRHMKVEDIEITKEEMAVVVDGI
ncbi:conserved phage C-terminal domain-containing protein [Loigolactobacillus iwatensis]|uniref:conserved phage C-terminal domain-containing protein n=1 Tax=Loigolactobacillus iwatensis TaxID=1267156 RepID=UPI000F7ECB76|nr:conserved phage C-terminal domain-containing protein [Loigolactobacillus iwatensis]